MKIRQGFVSNSSSSSYIMVLPIEFDLEKDLDINAFVKHRSESEWDDDVTFEQCDEVAKKIIKNGYVDTDEDYEDFSIISDLFSDYELTSAEGGSDNVDSITLISTSKVLKAVGLDEKSVTRLVRKQKLKNIKDEN